MKKYLLTLAFVVAVVLIGAGSAQATAIQDALTVSGMSTFNNMMTVNGAFRVLGDANEVWVDGKTTLDGDVVMRGGNLIIGNGNTQATIDTNSWDITSAGNISTSGTLTVTGATTLSSTLAVTGASTFTGVLTTVGNATVGGDLTVSGSELYLTPVASSASSTEGTLYYDSDDDNLYVYANGAFVDLTAAASSALPTLDDAYNNASGAATIVVDNGDLTLRSNAGATGDIVVDLNNTGDFLIQNAATTFVTFDDSGNTTIASGTLALNNDVVTSDGDLAITGATGANLTATAGDVDITASASSVIITAAEAETNAIRLLASGGGIDIDTVSTITIDTTDDELQIATDTQDVVLTGSAEGTAAMTFTAGDLVLTDGDITLSGGEVAVTTDDLTTDAVTITGSTLTTGQALAVVYDASNHTSGNIVEVSDADAGVDFAIAEDGATTITGSAEGTAVLTLTTGDVVVTDGDITVSGGEVAITTDDTTTDAVTINGNTLTTGQAVAITYDASTHSSGNIFEIADNDAGVDFAVAEDGATTLTGTAEGTTVLTLTAGDAVITDGDLTLSGGEVAITTDDNTTDAVTISGNTLTTGQALAIIYDASTHTSGNVFEISDADAGVDFAVSEDGATVITGSAEGTASLTQTLGDHVITDGDLTLSGGEVAVTTDDTTTDAVTVNGNTLTTGQVLAMTYDASTHTSGNLIELSDNDSGVDFSVSEDGATVIAGNAETTAALTLTAGDLIVTDGDVTMSSGELSLITDDLTTDAATIDGDTLTTGQTLALTYDASTHTSGNIFEISDHDAAVDFAVAEDGATTITGSAEGTAALTITTGDFVVSDGDVTLSGGEVAVTTDDTTTDAFTITGNTLTTGQTLALTYDASTHTSGNVFEIADNDAGVDFAVAEDGATTIAGNAENTAALTLTAGDIVVTDGDVTVSGGEVALTTDETTADGVTISGNTLTTGQALAIIYDNSTHSSGNVFEISDADAGVDFAVGEDGVTTLTGAVEGTPVLVLTTGDAVVTDGDITVSAGEMSLITDDTANDAVTFDGDTLTTGQTLVLTYDASTHTSGNVFEVSDHDTGVDFAVGEDGVTTLTGTALATNVLVLTAGDVSLTSGNIKQTAGTVYRAVTTATAGLANGETLDTSNGVNQYDPGGASRTGVILEAPTANGQIVYIINIADAAETITPAVVATSNVSNGATSVIGQNEAMGFVAGTIAGGALVWFPMTSAGQ